MDYTLAVGALNEYAAMSNEEVRTKCYNLIRSYGWGGVPYIAEKANLPIETLRVIMKLTVYKNHRPTFDTFVRLMALGDGGVTDYVMGNHHRAKSSRPVGRPRIHPKVYHTPRVNRTADERAQHRKDYQHSYYERVTKAKRAERKKNERIYDR